MSVRRWLWRHPETSVLALSALAWALLFAPLGLPGSLSMDAMPSMGPPAPVSPVGAATMARMPGMAPHTGITGPARVAAMPRGLRMTGLLGPVATGETGAADAAASMHWTLAMFLVMVVAMMLPASTESVRLAAALSLWRRRMRAIFEWTAGFIGVWVLAGAAILLARSLAIHNGVLHPGPVPLTVALLLAAAWQLTPFKRLALNGCHRSAPLAPTGLRADRDCLCYGAMIGCQCVIGCGPMMAAMTLSDRSQTILMVGITGIVVTERLRHRTPKRASAAALSLLALAAL